MEPKVTKLLSGGLNLLAPGDATPEGQCVAAENWRTDQAGNLRSRKSRGAAVVNLPEIVTAMVTALRATGPQRYYGAGVSFYKDAAQLVTGLTGDPLQLVSFQGRVWMMNPVSQKKDDGTNTYNWTPTAPTGAPTFVAGGAATGGLNGNYSYYVTGVTDEGEETNPSPALAVTGLGANDSVTITRPAFTDAQITQWNVYRQGGSFPLQSYKVNSTEIPLATTTYVDLGTDPGTGDDDQTDLGLAELGVAMPTDHTPAPPAKGLAGPYFQKLLAFNSPAHPNRIWWTPSDEPSYFPGSTSEQDGNWVDIGEEGEQVLAIAVFPRIAIIFKERSVHRLVGDPDDINADIERTNVEIGLLGGKAWTQAGSTLYLQGSEGAYVGTFDAAQKLTADLDPIFKQDGVVTTGAIPSLPVNPSDTIRSLACMAYRNGRLYYSYADSSSATNNVTLVFDAGKWFSDSRGFNALYDEGQGGQLLGAIGGKVYELDNGQDETDIPLVYQSRYENQGAPENQKRYSDIVVEHNTGGRVFTVYAKLDNGEEAIAVGTFSSTEWTQTTFTLNDETSNDPVEYRNLAVRLECLTGNAIAEIYTLIAHYLPMERNARTYDTGRIPLEKVSLIGALELDLQILSGSVSFKLLAGVSDMTEVASGAAAGPVLETVTAQATDGTEARWVRLLISGDDFRCLGARLQVRPYGAYLAGVGDIFRSGDLTFGSPRPKLLQQIRVDCHPDGAIPGEFFSDTPAPLSVKQTLGLVATEGRAWQRQTFPPNFQGRVCRVEFTAPAVCRLYAVQVRGKILGEGGGWQWFDVPVPETPEGFSWMPLPVSN